MDLLEGLVKKLKSGNATSPFKSQNAKFLFYVAFVLEQKLFFSFGLCFVFFVSWLGTARRQHLVAPVKGLCFFCRVAYFIDARDSSGKYILFSPLSQYDDSTYQNGKRLSRFSDFSG